ncbi:MAG: tetratricopeptide repeat protein [Pirellulaceae bacterium]
MMDFATARLAIALLLLFTSFSTAQDAPDRPDAGKAGENRGAASEPPQDGKQLDLPAVPEFDTSEPVVARMEMKLTLDKQVIDTIQKGDLLTVLAVREKSLVIQTFNGFKGAVAKTNAAKLAESVAIYDDLIAETPEDGRRYTLRASAHWATGDAVKALADFDKAIELGYDEAHAFASRGLFHAASGNYEAAIADYTTAIEKDPKDDVPLMNRASVYMATGKYELAIEDYTSAIELKPENPVLYSQRAVALKLLNKPNEAIEDYSRTLKLVENDVSALMGRGFLKFQLGEHAAAIDDFGRVVKLAPENALALNNRGYNYQLLKKFDLALADYRRATELAPGYLLALQNLAWLLTTCENKDLRDAAVAIEIAKKVCEITEFKNLSDLTLLAAAHAEAGEFETAIGWQEKVIELASDEQKLAFGKILALYQDKQPLDLKLLEVEEPETPPAKASEEK